jgi:hypothetical protein
MIRKIYGKIAAGSLLLAAMTLLVPLTVSAQDAERSYSAVRTVHVKPSMVSEFVALQTQLNDAAKAAGQSGRGVWQEVRGDLATFHIVSQLESFAQYDEDGSPPMDEDAWAEWVEAIGNVTASSSRTISVQYPGLAIPGDEDAAPNLLLLRFTTVAPGQGGAYRAWLRDKLVPALKAAGTTGHSFSRTIFGGNTDVHIQATSIDNWAALDGAGPLSGLSDEERADMFANFSDMVWGNELRILRFRADLSRRSPEE